MILMLGVIHKGRPHEGEGVRQIRTPVLILPVKGQILRTLGRGEKWQNFEDVLYGWPRPLLKFVYYRAIQCWQEE